MSESTEPEIGPFTIGDPLASPDNPVEVPDRDDEWPVTKGFTWVFLGDGNRELTRPVIIADGFNHGESDLKKLYQFLEGEQYGFIGELRRRGMDVILLGFKNRTASVLDNAEAVRATVLESIARRVGNHRLVVGGFSMGGLVTRYALARMESRGEDHQTGVYFSYDTPHRGASIPIGVQSFSYLLPGASTSSPTPSPSRWTARPRGRCSGSTTTTRPGRPASPRSARHC